MACLVSSCKYYLIGIFIIVAVFISNTDAQCSPTSSGVKRFGTNCQYNCHCINNEHCDATSGECDSGCDFEWVGPACQYKNIAIGKMTRLIDNKKAPRYAYLANDRDLSTCSYTGTSVVIRSVEPWWTLWLSTYTTIRKLSFVTHENYRPYFPNFKIKVQNYTYDDFETKTYKDDGVLCYQHDASIPQQTRTDVTCTGTPVGNLVRLQLANTSTQLVLCDLRVYGDCDYGDGCRQKCSKNCYERGKFMCDSVDGTCLHGCKAGWIGHQCTTECVEGTYGLNCSNTCKNCYKGCHKVTGICSQCHPGWKGDYCTAECESGKYSWNCQRDCGHCLSSSCNHINGLCPNGCAAGYKLTDMCNEECVEGTYGLNCSNTCTNCYKACHKVTGICSQCHHGWKGNYCTTECESGKYGRNCGSDCGHCLYSSCYHINGHCPNGCAAGFKLTNMCNEECDNSEYGLNCSNICSHNCDGVCDKVTGNCPSCKAGWRGPQCTIECEQGKYGVNCETLCGACAENKTCDHVNGICADVCRSGYKPTSLCQLECDDGWYGINCSEKCSTNCKENTFCRKADGSCLECKSGLQGKYCEICLQTEQRTCSKFCVSEVGIAGLVIAFLVLNITTVFIAIWMTRKRMQLLRKQNSSEGPAVSYANVEAAENAREDAANVYETINRKSDTEHTYG